MIGESIHAGIRPNQTRFIGFSTLIGFRYGFGFYPILKHGYETINEVIGTYSELILKFVPNIENHFITPFI